MNKRGGYAKIPVDKLLAPAFLRFGHMVLMLIQYVVLIRIVSVKGILTQEWADMHLIGRCFYAIGVVWLKLNKLMVGFIAMEANSIACGQDYTPATKDKPENFNSIRCIYVRNVYELSSFKEDLGAWNICVHKWLKYYVMMNLIDRTKPRGQM